MSRAADGRNGVVECSGGGEGGGVVRDNGVIKGGLLITEADRRRVDVAFDAGTITAIEEHIDIPPGVPVIDAEGSYVLPGGVDPHVHLETTFRGVRTADDFATGTAAAAAGGTTTVLDFCFPEPGQRLTDAVDLWKARVAARGLWVDIGVHVVLVRPGPEVLDQLPELVAAGTPSVKMYLAYPNARMSDDDQLFEVMQAAARVGLTVLVHAENGPVIETLRRQALEQGRTEPRWHASTRPIALEEESVHRAGVLAGLTGARLHVVHLSGAGPSAAVTAARRSGAAVTGETCMHYLIFDESRLNGDLQTAAPFVCSPPPRSTSDQKALWRALADGRLSVLASDHCGFHLHHDKVVGDDFTAILNGVPGVEQRLILAHHFGVRAGHLTMERLVEVCCVEPARRFGLYPRKGTLAVGSDADVVIFDPDRTHTISARTQHSAIDHLPYEGITVTGAVDTVIARGRRIVVDGALVPLVPQHRPGRFVRRSPGTASDADGMPTSPRSRP
ncbi:dihydropyrimidinase [Gordonia sp. NPDC003376]